MTARCLSSLLTLKRVFCRRSWPLIVTSGPKPAPLRSLNSVSKRTTAYIHLDKYALQSRTPSELCCVVESLFPAYFGFQYCCILFLEAESKDLIKLRLINPKFVVPEETTEFLAESECSDEEEKRQTKAKDNEIVEYSSFVRVPSNDGLTGLAIA